MKRACVGAGVVCLMLTAGSLAAIIPLPLTPADFNSLGTLASVSGWPAMTTLMTATGLEADVISQPFRDTTGGDYFYLYQVANTGLPDWHLIEVFTIWPFHGAGGATQVGYLTANVPSAFSLGTVAPTGASVKTTTINGPTISFGFPGYINPIDAGQTSMVLYIRSPLSPAMALGNIIDGEIAQGPVIANIPEPTTIGLLIFGSAGLFLVPRRRPR